MVILTVKRFFERRKVLVSDVTCAHLYRPNSQLGLWELVQSMKRLHTTNGAKIIRSLKNIFCTVWVDTFSPRAQSFFYINHTANHCRQLDFSFPKGCGSQSSEERQPVSVPWVVIFTTVEHVNVFSRNVWNMAVVV